MSKTALITFSDAEIKRQASTGTARDLRDARFPGVYFRFGQRRERGEADLPCDLHFLPSSGTIAVSYTHLTLPTSLRV